MRTLLKLFSNSLSNRQEFILLGTLVLVPNLVVLCCVVWPGFLQADQVYSSVWLKIGEPNEWHSFLFTLVTFPFFDNAQGLGYYGILYNILFAATVAWSVVKLRTLGVLTSKKGCLALTAIFALSPCFLFYTNVLYSSESIFMIVLLPLTICIIAVVNSKGAWFQKPSNCIAFVALLYAAFELRKNAVLMVLLILLLLLLCYREHWRPIFATTAILLVAILTTTGIFKLANIAPSPTQEMVSIPAQQIARVYVDDGYIPKEIEERLNQIHIKEDWKENYLPSVADPMKSGLAPDAQFIADWLVLGMHNPGSYTHAYLDLTRSFWLWGDHPSHNKYLNAADFTLSRSWTPEYVENAFTGKAQLSNGFYETMGNREPLRDAAVLGWDYLMFNRTVPVVTDVLKGVFFNVSLPFYLSLAILAVAFWKKRWNLLIISIPLWSTVLAFLIFAPVACYRYSAMLYMIVPLLLLLLIKTVQAQRRTSSDN